jgi:hypothetical protein
MVSTVFMKATTVRQNAWVGVVLLYVALFFSTLLAAGSDQQNPPPKRPGTEARIVRIEYGSSSGMCLGYCYSQTTIEEKMVRSVSRTNYSLSGNRDKEHPDKKSKWKITTEQWKRAKAAVDTESLFALPDRIGCPGCVDEPVDWITVEYNDGSTKSVLCNSGGPATDMADKIKAALAPEPRKGSDHQP